MSNKIFDTFDFESLTEKDDLSTSLSQNYENRVLNIVFLFPKNLWLTLNILNTKKDGQGWINQLPTYVTEADGAIEVPLGVYKVGETISIGFRVVAPLQEIPRIGVVVLGDQKQPALLTERQTALKNSESWFEIKSYKVGG
jgi:hypothetical protein